MPKKKSQKKRRKTSGKRGFGQREFVRSVWGMMEEQEKTNPALSLLHERLAPEFEQVTTLIQKLFHASAEAEEVLLREIYSYREKAVVPLLDFIRRLKKSGDSG